MEIDKWNYYDDGDNIIIVNNFFYEDIDEFLQCNVYRANKKDIKKNVSVHDVMKLIEEIE